MGQTTASAAGRRWVGDITRYQWMIFLIAWLGWSLDNTDFNLFALVLRPAVTELLGGNPTAADIGRVGGILSMTGLYMYLWLDTYDLYPYLLPVFGYFVFGAFSGHAVYLPELFPTHVRATAVSFCNGSGRVITSFGPFAAGLLAGALNGAFNQAAAVMTCFAGLRIVAAPLGRETRDEGRCSSEINMTNHN